MTYNSSKYWTGCAMVVLLFAAGIGFISWRFYPTYLIWRTRQEMELIISELEDFYHMNLEFPDRSEGLQRLGSLKKKTSIDYVDSWGTPYLYYDPGLAEFNCELISAGPDRTFSTRDDISKRSDIKEFLDSINHSK